MPRPPINFRLEMQKAPPSPFEDADEIAKRYGFAAEFPLRDRLDIAAGMYRTTCSANFPTPQERRRRLDLIEKEVRAVLAGRIQRGVVLARLLTAGGRSGLPFADDSVELRLALGPPVLFEVAELEALLLQVERARTSLVTRRAPVSGDRALRSLVYDLGRIWQEGTRQRPGLGRDGPFPRFLEEIARRVEVPRGTSREALVKLHSRWGRK